MDKSSHYIEMCESAGVIQQQWKPDFGDFFVSMSSGQTSPCLSILSELEKKMPYLKTIKAVWLPRQDQLQEMLIEKYATPWDLAIAFSNVLMADKASYFDRFKRDGALKDLYASMREEKRFFNFLRDEDLGNLSII
jgi:hypothetical protein